MRGWSVFIPINETIKQRPLQGSRLNCSLSLIGCPIPTLVSHQRAPRYRHPDEGPVMSGVAILGLAAVSVLLGVNIAIAVAVVVLDRR